MVLWRTVERSFSVAVIGLALSSVAVGQVAGPGLGNGSVDPDAQIDADATADAAVPPVDAAASVDVNANSNVGKTLGTQTGEVQSGIDATPRTNRPNINSNVQSNANAEATAQQNRVEESQALNAAASENPFGATFDSRTTDRLVIQNLQPNSTATRLGLQAGDRIIGFNGQTYNDVSQFDRDLAQLDRNSDTPIIYERNGQRFTQRFRMPPSDVHQTYNAQTDGNQGWNGNSGQFGQGSHSLNRPVYGVSSSSNYSAGMHQGQSYMGNATGSGSGSYYGSACCGDSMPVAQAYSGHYQHRQHHGGRRHRNRCR